jgi:hypothetical protein
VIRIATCFCIVFTILAILAHTALWMAEATSKIEPHPWQYSWESDQTCSLPLTGRSDSNVSLVRRLAATSVVFGVRSALRRVGAGRRIRGNQQWAPRESNLPTLFGSKPSATACSRRGDMHLGSKIVPPPIRQNVARNCQHEHSCKNLSPCLPTLITQREPFRMSTCQCFELYHR